MAAPAQLPGGIIYYNILPRLPYRALMRLTAVCKAWRLIICSNDGFAAAQARTPSSASVDIARCIRGSLEILSPWAADVVPRDPFFSLVEVDHRRLSPSPRAPAVSSVSWNILTLTTTNTGSAGRGGTVRNGGDTSATFTSSIRI
jgi:hypothetical protein